MTVTSVLDRERSKQWHRQMSEERRCHYCGRPSSIDFAKGCEEHKGMIRSITKRSNERLRQERLLSGLCVNCGKRTAREECQSCPLCGRRRSLQNRDWRERKSVIFFDYVIDKGLIDVKIASKIIEIDRSSIHWLIRLGVLKVELKAQGKYWLREALVNRYRKRRINKMLSIVRCSRCDHDWYLRLNTKRLRCPRCGGYDILRLDQYR